MTFYSNASFVILAVSCYQTSVVNISYVIYLDNFYRYFQKVLKKTNSVNISSVVSVSRGNRNKAITVRKRRGKESN